jgi:iron complex transport system substrate-binding protein
VVTPFSISRGPRRIVCLTEEPTEILYRLEALASWCGKAFERAPFEGRPGFAALSAVKAGRVHEVPAEIILQPGPACLTDGLDFLIDVLR